MATVTAAANGGLPAAVRAQKQSIARRVLLHLSTWPPASGQEVGRKTQSRTKIASRRSIRREGGGPGCQTRRASLLHPFRPDSPGLLPPPGPGLQFPASRPDPAVGQGRKRTQKKRKGIRSKLEEIPAGTRRKKKTQEDKTASRHRIHAFSGHR